MGKTLVLGASANPARYSYRAAHALLGADEEVLLVGRREGEVAGIPIHSGQPHFTELDTITLYIGPKHQPEFYDYMVELNPRRVILNPGTENNALIELLRDNDIEPVIACTLVMLSIGNY